MPKKTKYRKFQRGRNRGKAQSGNKIILEIMDCWL